MLRISLLFAAVLLPVPLAAQPAISFEETGVVATGATAQGRVVWFSVAREIADSTATLVRRERIVADEDGDGAVRLDLDRPVPLRSIWVALDLTTGAWSVATPEGYPLRQVDPPGLVLRRGEGGQADFLEDARGFVEILMVRPGVGAWGITVGDGGGSDGDGAYDGRLTVDLDQLRGSGSQAAAVPRRFDARDLVFVIDPNEMNLAVRTGSGTPQ